MPFDGDIEQGSIRFTNRIVSDKPQTIPPVMTRKCRRNHRIWRFLPTDVFRYGVCEYVVCSNEHSGLFHLS